MIESLKTWFKDRFAGADTAPPPSRPNMASYRQRLIAKDKPSPQPKANPKANADAKRAEDELHAHGTIESHGPGKNVYVQSPLVREELGTHESLKIIDESLLEVEEPDGIDPYNTGQFDKSRKWDQRFRK